MRGKFPGGVSRSSLTDIRFYIIPYSVLFQLLMECAAGDAEPAGRLALVAAQLLKQDRLLL